MKNRVWLVTLIVVLTGVVVAACNFKVPPTMVVLMDEMQVSVTEGGILMSMSVIAGIILALPAGGIIMKTGPKKLGAFSLACTLVGSVVGAVAPNFTILMISRAIEGIGFAFISVVAPSIIAVCFPPEKRGLPMALWALWISLGMLFIFNVTNAIVPAFGWRGDWWLVAILAAVMLVVFVLFVKVPEPEADPAEKGASQPSLKEGFQSMSSWLLCLIFICFATVVSAFTTYFPTYIVQVLGLDVAVANSYSGFMAIGMIVGGLAMGFVLNKVKNRPALLIFCMALTGIFGYFTFEITSLNILLAYVFFAGVVYSTPAATLFTVAPDSALSPASIGMALSLCILGQNVASGIAPVIIGTIVENSGYVWSSVTPILLGAGIMGVIFAILFLITMNKKAAAQIRVGKSM
ncbi:putative MFS family arabinose efflux permease [Desulfitobacterium sp. LBE]|uniref:MFS transporter n=1 Tax=Desulfitobacterium TaxID=36853 RepID=UPI0003629DD7|nr:MULTISPECIES: MFS transporter [Desulfitobacterium]TWH56921.1 putative MFS family arabinose efflux permease [Desulfitobacterium sp. LBE]